MNMHSNSEFEQQDIFYGEHYARLMGTGLISQVWRAIHFLMEYPFRGVSENRILEVGAGNGEHFKAVSSDFQQYFATDIRIEQLTAGFEGVPKVIVERQDICKLSYENAYFDRTIVTCVLVHLDAPTTALSEIHRVTKSGGWVCLYLPCEPGLLLRMIRKFSTHAKAKKLGMTDITYLHFLEHKNYFSAVNYFIQREFISSRIKSIYLPFPWLSWNFNLFKLYFIKLP
jgi:phosphatidylethanolamine/phosphatidyl-N-methylethanolamine N-methyltransferase